jgi:hypothetical protein
MEIILAVATVLGGLSALWYFWGRLSALDSARDVLARILRLRSATLSQAWRRGYQDTARFLVHWLEADQDTSGHHYGQFGRHVNIGEERHWESDPEVLAAKPRVYLTGWPCSVLNRHGLAPHALRRAQHGLRQLFRENVVRVSQGASPGMHPTDQPTVVSYRHTMRTVQILLELGEKPSALAVTLGQILDEQDVWQLPEGGWAQCDSLCSGADLWASAYAAALLFLLSHQDWLEGEAQAVAVERLRETVGYLDREWSASRWAYGGVSSEQNAPVVFHEVAACLQGIGSPLRGQVMSWLKEYLTPAGTLSNAYFSQCQDLAAASGGARVAYALYLGGEPPSVWRLPYEAAIAAFGAGHGVNSADIAFLLDLTKALQRAPDERTKVTASA